jgi:hypothetical protein
MAYTGRFGQSDDFRREELKDNRTLCREPNSAGVGSFVL